VPLGATESRQDGQEASQREEGPPTRSQRPCDSLLYGKRPPPQGAERKEALEALATLAAREQKKDHRGMPYSTFGSDCLAAFAARRSAMRSSARRASSASSGLIYGLRASEPGMGGELAWDELRPFRGRHGGGNRSGLAPLSALFQRREIGAEP